VTVDEDPAFQRRMWLGQRVGWVLIAVTVLAGLAGVFGSGPLSSSSAETADLRVEYERFARLQQPTRFKCVFTGTPAKAEIALNRDFVDAVRVDAIMPTPVQIEAAGEGMVYRFAGSSLAAVTFDVTPSEFPSEFGMLDAIVRTATGTVAFQQFVYP
jgi:hypothetical protein